MDKTDTIQIKFDGNNYFGWAFHLNYFVMGHALMGYLDGTVTKEDKTAATWDQNNSKEVTWILNSIDPSLSISLQSFSKASGMWLHLQSVYHQVNKARKSYLDFELTKYNQGNRNVQEYYNDFLTL